MIINKKLKPKLISMDDNHICVSACGLTVCGFYFNPTEEIDDICRIVSQVVNRCPDRNRLLLAGDINLRPNTEDFEALSELLEEEEIILRSDPTIPTYFHSKGSSTLDHIFAPVRMDILQTGVFDKGISDHAAITAVTHIKRLPKDNFVKTRDVHKTWFDVGSAVMELHDGKESINDLSFDQLVESSMGKIKKHIYILPKKKKKTKKPWFNQFLEEAREHMFLMKRTGSHLQYQLARTSFHFFL